MGEHWRLLTSRPHGEGQLLSSHCTFRDSGELRTIGRSNVLTGKYRCACSDEV